MRQTFAFGKRLCVYISLGSVKNALQWKCFAKIETGFGGERESVRAQLQTTVVLTVSQLPRWMSPKPKQRSKFASMMGLGKPRSSMRTGAFGLLLDHLSQLSAFIPFMLFDLD